MNDAQARAYLDSFINYEMRTDYSYTKAFTLARMQRLLTLLNNPQNSYWIIHVAGSKAKGSVCAFCASMLREAGYRVGLFTSPHLQDLRERFRVVTPHQEYADFAGMISEGEFASCMGELRDVVVQYQERFPKDTLTFFEVTTALALLYFRRQKVTIAVLETGLGGRFDATNACAADVSVITPISYEHTIRLGKSLRKIAFEKASIIKDSNKKTTQGYRIAVTSQQPKSCLHIITQMAKRTKTTLFQAGKDFSFHKRRQGCFDWHGFYTKIKNLRIALCGDHQLANASLAIATLWSLRHHGIKIGKGAMRRGLAVCRWPGRCETIQNDPCIIIDGAQNAASVAALRATMREYFANRKVWIIFGIACDKEIQQTCREISKISSDIILTRAQHVRAADPDRLISYFKHNNTHVTDSLAAAIKFAHEKAHKHDIILITGSLYLCGEARILICDNSRQSA